MGEKVTKAYVRKPKQVLICRTDLNMRKGKMVSQGAHASMAAILNRGQLGISGKGTAVHPFWKKPGINIVDEDYSDATHYRLEINSQDESDIFKWVIGSFTKICVGIGSEEELRLLIKQAEEAGLPCSLMIDNGETEFNGQDTVTAGCIGPADSDLIDPITSHLKLL